MILERAKYEREKKTTFETFNDGVCNIYKLADISLPGFKPVFKPKFYRAVPFHYKTIGVKRNYEAMQNQVRIDELISIMFSMILNRYSTKTIRRLAHHS